MSSARTILVSAFIDSLNYRLRNEYEKQWTEVELLEYINNWYEFIYMMMAEHECDLVMTGSGSFTTVAGTERYLLSDNSMGDLWTIPGSTDAGTSNIRLSGLNGLELCDRADRTPHLIEKDNGTTSYSQPNRFYLHGGYIGLLPFPDDAYTVYIEDYIPNFTTLALSDNMPFQNIFNPAFTQGVSILAKNRENEGTAIEASLMEIFQDRAMSIIRQRQIQSTGMVI